MEMSASTRWKWRMAYFQKKFRFSFETICCKNLFVKPGPKLIQLINYYCVCARVRNLESFGVQKVFSVFSLFEEKPTQPNSCSGEHESRKKRFFFACWKAFHDMSLHLLDAFSIWLAFWWHKRLILHFFPAHERKEEKKLHRKVVGGYPRSCEKKEMKAFVRNCEKPTNDTICAAHNNNNKFHR